VDATSAGKCAVLCPACPHPAVRNITSTYWFWGPTGSNLNARITMSRACLAPISTHRLAPCPCWFTGKLSQLLWKCSLRTRAHALHIVTYILITWDRALFSSVPRAFALIDTVYRDLTGGVVHTLRTLPTP
jgi:hypothetical protein